MIGLDINLYPKVKDIVPIFWQKLTQIKNIYGQQFNTFQHSLIDFKKYQPILYDFKAYI